MGPRGESIFEAAEVGSKIGRAEYQEAVPRLRTELLELQSQLRKAGFSVIILVNGVEGAGKSETVNTLLEWLDARWVQVHTLSDPTDEERDRPRFWRFWRDLPPRGTMGIFFGSWYTWPVLHRFHGDLTAHGLEHELDRINALEKTLADDGALILKFWLHVSKKEQKKRMERLRTDPDRKWMVSPAERELARHFDAFIPITSRVLRRTDTEVAPWHVVEAGDERYRYLTVGTLIRDALQQRLELKEVEGAAAPSEPESPPICNHLQTLPLDSSLPREEYEAQLPRLQGRLHRLHRELREEARSLTIVFEGPDASGKGGAIRRITQAIDAREYRVISVAAPTEEERAQPYLWRFWRHVPRVGHVTIYDRSWYGRVLVERVEGFCRTDEWRRAYDEINDFEAQLVESGTVLVKFWLHISSEEQLRRFRDREATPYKRHKITEEDWRNRDRWDAYEVAACEMVDRTSTALAPWDLIEANDKPWARTRILTTLCERIEAALYGRTSGSP